MKAAFQMNHPARLNPHSDSTLAIIEEACRRGIACHFFTPTDMSWSASGVTARTRPISVDSGRTPVWELGEAATLSLHDMDVVWMRQDPPFNMQYITTTYLLERLLPETCVVNHPASVRNAPEKLSTLAFPQFLPPTLVSLDADTIAAFAEAHGTVVAKPLHGFGGHGVFKFTKGEANIATLIEQWAETAAEPLMWQQFLPEVATRDTRVLLIDGEVTAHFTRVPQEGSIRANMRVGGTPTAAKPLTPRQQEICRTLGPMFRTQGLLLVGLDLIGDYLTEINVTCPTGLRAVEQLSGVNLAATLWDRLSKQ